MQGLKKQSYRLRIKSTSALQNPRPQESTHGVCYVCNEFREVLRQDGRCHAPECESLLLKKCIEGGVGVRKYEGGHSFSVIVPPPPQIVQSQEYIAKEDAADEKEDLDSHTCPCGKALKMPNRDRCAVCYRTGNVARHKQKRRKRGRGTKDRRMANKIKGLEKVKI